MKKSLLFLITIMVLGACTSNSTVTDDMDEVTDPVDVSNKKPISVQFEGGNVAFDLVTISYDGQGKIQSFEDPTINYRQDYVYEGEFLKRIENYTNNVLGSQTVYEYENGLVIRSLDYNADNEVTLRRTFVYENNVLASYTNEYPTSSLGDTTWDFTYDASQNTVTRTNRDDPQMYQVTTYDENKSPYTIYLRADC